MNQVNVMGRLTREPDVKTYGNEGKTFTRFTLAVDRPYQKGQERKVDFIPCVAFGKTGEFIGNYADKGARIIVNGSLKIGSYTDKEGVKRLTADVFVDRAELIDWPKKDGGSKENPMGAFGANVGFDEEIPF